ncbi:MAG: PIN domain nuclease [Prolixibacteraceae bacterium]|nr:PIN domain nuclease [Prolixibacteraceae bacterium]
MIVVDTSVWIDYVNGVITPQTNLLDIELENSRIVTGDLIITEFLQGFRNDKQYYEAKELMESLEYYDFVGKEIAIKAAENFRLLRKNGITVRKTIDVLIATFCVENGFELIHDDRDFDQMEQILGLRIRR